MVENFARLTCDRCGVHEDVPFLGDEWAGDVMRRLENGTGGWLLMENVKQVGLTDYGEMRAFATRRILCPECAGEYAEFLSPSE